MTSRLVSFADEIQICGAKEIYRSNFFIVKLVWIIIVCFGSIATGWYIRKNIIEYTNFPTGTKVCL